jgi:hypothetical protein
VWLWAQLLLPLQPATALRLQQVRYDVQLLPRLSQLFLQFCCILVFESDAAFDAVGLAFALPQLLCQVLNLWSQVASAVFLPSAVLLVDEASQSLYFLVHLWNLHSLFPERVGKSVPFVCGPHQLSLRFLQFLDFVGETAQLNEFLVFLFESVVEVCDFLIGVGQLLL